MQDESDRSLRHSVATAMDIGRRTHRLPWRRTRCELPDLIARFLEPRDNSRGTRTASFAAPSSQKTLSRPVETSMGGATCPRGAGSSPLWGCGGWLVDGAGRGDHRRAAGGRGAFSAGTGAAADMVVANGSCGKSSRRGSPEPNTAGEDPSCRRRQALEAPGCGVLLGVGTTRFHPALPCSCTWQPRRHPGARSTFRGQMRPRPLVARRPTQARRQGSECAGSRDLPKPHAPVPQLVAPASATDRPVHKHGSAR